MNSSFITSRPQIYTRNRLIPLKLATRGKDLCRRYGSNKMRKQIQVKPHMLERVWIKGCHWKLLQKKSHACIQKFPSGGGILVQAVDVFICIFSHQLNLQRGD